MRLKRQYQCSVTQVVIFLQETTNEIAFTEEYQDETTVHHYRSIRLWEQDSAIFLDNPALLPLAPLTRTDSPQKLLAQVAQRLARIDDKQDKQNLAGHTEILAGLRFNKDLIRQFLREDIMKESVIYQDILQQGRQQEALSFCMHLLRLRFSEIEPLLIESVQILSVEQLESLGGALLSISTISELQAWLEQQTKG